jgi:hypothetical protein
MAIYIMMSLLTYLVTYSVALVHKRTIPTERPPLVGEASANFCGYRVARGQRDIPTAVLRLFKFYELFFSLNFTFQNHPLK